MRLNPNELSDIQTSANKILGENPWFIDHSEIQENVKNAIKNELPRMDFSIKDKVDIKKWLGDIIGASTVPIFNLKKFYDRPVYLTSEQIDDIMSVVPPINAIVQEVA